MDKKVTITLTEEQVYDIMFILRIRKMELMQRKYDTFHVEELYDAIRKQVKGIPCSPNLKGDRFLAMYL